MRKCPVCNQSQNDLVCSVCGFDASRNYEAHPTYSKVTGKSVAQYRQEWSANQPNSDNAPVAQEPTPPQEAPASAPAYNQTQAEFAKYRICLDMVENGKADLETVRTSFASLNQSLSALDFDPDEQLPGFSLRWSVAAEIVAKQQKAIDQEAEKQLQAEQRKQQQAQQKQAKQEQREQAKQARADKRAASKQAQQERREDFADSLRSMFRKREPSWETVQHRQERQANTKQFFSEHGLFIVMLLFSLGITLMGIHFSLGRFLYPPLMTTLGTLVYCHLNGVRGRGEHTKHDLLAKVLFVVACAGYLIIRGKYLQAFLSANLVLMVFHTKWFIPHYAANGIAGRYIRLLVTVAIALMFLVGIERWFIFQISVSPYNSCWYIPVVAAAAFILLVKLADYELGFSFAIILLFFVQASIILFTMFDVGTVFACYILMSFVAFIVGLPTILFVFD